MRRSRSALSFTDHKLLSGVFSRMYVSSPPEPTWDRRYDFRNIFGKKNRRKKYVFDAKHC
jgi:hypothetical protein